MINQIKRKENNTHLNEIIYNCYDDLGWIVVGFTAILIYDHIYSTFLLPRNSTRKIIVKITENPTRVTMAIKKRLL